jgi:SAM-dependent methyltransferase
MKSEQELKELVKEKYSQIALQSKTQNETSCCGSGCSTVDYTVFAESYEHLGGYHAEADLGLGCGLPTEFAKIKQGDTVVDLGSGAGNDCFIARALTGENGLVIGVDMTETMVQKARQNAEKLNFSNVKFYLGEIEQMPLEDAIADVVVSNCVLNLVPNKHNALKETFRILKQGGHFSISDVVLKGDLPEGLKKDAEMYAGCVSGAIDKDEYLKIIQEIGFQNIIIQKERPIILPDEILKQYLSEEEIVLFKGQDIGIYSITVYAEKSKCCQGECC